MNLAALALLALLQEKPVTTTKEKADTIKVNVSGRTTYDLVYRGREMTGYTSSESNPVFIPFFGATFPNPATAESETTVEGFAAVRIDVEFTGKVSGVVEFGTKRIDGDPDEVGGGIQRLGDDSSYRLRLREARLNLAELFAPEISAQLGMPTWTFDVRGKGHSLAFNPRQSQTITRNLDSLGQLNVAEALDARLIEAAFCNDVEPFGGTVTWSADPLTIEVILLPLVEEGGSASRDVSLYAVDGWYTFGDPSQRSRAGLILALSKQRGPSPDPNGTPGDLITLGGGTSVKLLDGALEVFGEAYVQTGSVGETLAGARQKIDAKGNAFQLGFEYHHTVGNPLPVWFGASYTFLSGDGDTDPNDTKANRFASYEGVNELMILEDRELGLDWDSNYKAIKINLGAQFTAFTKNDLEVRALVGIAQAAEAVDPAGANEDDLGNEVDLRARWSVTPQVAIQLGIAQLFGSKILEKSMTAGGAGVHADDKTSLYLLGMDMKF
jgi:hypothetical protein